MEGAEEDKVPLVRVLNAGPEEAGGKPLPRCTMELKGGLDGTS